MTFYEKYLELCASVDKTPSGAALEMGLSKPTVNRWKNGGGITVLPERLQHILAFLLTV